MSTTPAVYLAYAPRGPGLMCAMFYFVEGRDVYGWWMGARDAEFTSAFFMLGDFFSARDTLFYATQGTDIYGGWRYEYSAARPELDKPVSVDEEMAHRLNQFQSAFAAEWLFFAGDSHIEDEVAAYGRGDLPVEPVNIKHARLQRLDKADVVWTYASPGFDMDVLDYLMGNWPLDYGAV